MKRSLIMGLAVACVVVAAVLGGGWLLIKPKPTPVADTTKPTVAVAVPKNGLEIKQGMLPVEVNVSDNQGVTKVEYRVDGEFKAVSYAAPFGVALDVAGLKPGSHLLVATAYDGAGNTATSTSVSFLVPELVTVAPSPTPVSTPAPAPVAKATTKKTPTPAPQPTATPTPAPPTPTPPPPADTTPPATPAIASLSDPGNYQVHVSWAAVTDNVGVTGYHVYRDNVLLTSVTSGLVYDDATTLPGHTYEYEISAYDAANNESGRSPVATIVLDDLTAFADSDVPFVDNNNDPGPINLGMRFRTSVAGKVNGVRFYKGAGNGGAHEGSLYTNAGTLLATGTFTGETTSGWQELRFATPVAITANTTYMVAYFAPLGHYSSNSSYFTTSHSINSYVTALADGTDGPNGVYKYDTASDFPQNTFSSGNYWVDVLFAPDSL